MSSSHRTHLAQIEIHNYQQLQQKVQPGDLLIDRDGQTWFQTKFDGWITNLNVAGMVQLPAIILREELFKETSSTEEFIERLNKEVLFQGFTRSV